MEKRRVSLPVRRDRKEKSWQGYKGMMEVGAEKRPLKRYGGLG